MWFCDGSAVALSKIHNFGYQGEGESRDRSTVGAFLKETEQKERNQQREKQKQASGVKGPRLFMAAMESDQITGVSTHLLITIQ